MLLNGMPRSTTGLKQSAAVNKNQPINPSKMSQQNQSKVFARGIYVNKKLIAGKELVELSFNADSFIAFLQEHKDEKGYVRVACWPKREADKYGTHNAELNTWKPTPKAEVSQEGTKDDLPF
jgi:hypothetical protein